MGKRSRRLGPGDIVDHGGRSQASVGCQKKSRTDGDRYTYRDGKNSEIESQGPPELYPMPHWEGKARVVAAHPGPMGEPNLQI